jgi:hypothetical protein
MNSAGENTPPEAPEPSVSDVANSFSSASISANPPAVRLPLSTSWMVA